MTLKAVPDEAGKQPTEEAKARSFYAKALNIIENGKEECRKTITEMNDSNRSHEASEGRLYWLENLFEADSNIAKEQAMIWSYQKKIRECKKRIEEWEAPKERYLINLENGQLPIFSD